MSFDIFYRPCRYETQPVERKNPFTGEVQAVLPVIPLSPLDLEAARDVLESAAAVGPDEHGGYRVQFRDGGGAEIYGGNDLDTGCMIAVRRGLSPHLVQFLFDLLRAADWVMLPAMEGNPAITALPRRAGGFADSLPEVVCQSAEELGAVLAGGFERWKRFRDQVVEK